jgi:hypothetical protein
MKGEADAEISALAPAPPGPEQESRTVLAARAIAERRPFQEGPSLCDELRPVEYSDSLPTVLAVLSLMRDLPSLGELPFPERNEVERRADLLRELLEDRVHDPARSTDSLEAERSMLSNRVAKISHQLSRRLVDVLHKFLKTSAQFRILISSIPMKTTIYLRLHWLKRRHLGVLRQPHLSLFRLL